MVLQTLLKENFQQSGNLFVIIWFIIYLEEQVEQMWCENKS